ncbi:MAG: zinc ribbon domain-containing protein [Candidatus Bathyarchaeia archaeon]
MGWGLDSEKKPKRVKCAKCGFENLVNASFCSGCGARLKPLPVEAKGRFDALCLLLFVGSTYLAVSLIFNVIYQVMIFAVPSLVSILLGVYACYRLYRGRFGRWVFVSSIVAVALGLGITFIVFLMGLNIRGVFGPGWVIYAAAAWRLWKDSKRS